MALQQSTRKINFELDAYSRANSKVISRGQAEWKACRNGACRRKAQVSALNLPEHLTCELVIDAIQ